MKKILIPMLDRHWTLEALHQACRLIRFRGGIVTLLHLIPAPHPLWLGYDRGLGSALPHRDLSKYAATAAEYGVTLTIQPMQYVTGLNALVQAAEMLGVNIVFSKKMTGISRLWSALQHISLARQLYRQHRWLIALDARDRTA